MDVSQYKVARRLNDTEMDVIHTSIESDGWAAGVITTFRFLGVDLAGDGPQIRPSDYAIPEDQWGEIAVWCEETAASDLGAINHMLDWMNYAPSGYREEAG